MAAASIAQVHRAEIEVNGARKPVAVKVLRPGIERRFKSDLDAFFFAARKAEAFSTEAQRLRLIEVVSTLARSVSIEMDFRLEAAAASEMAENTREDVDFRVPTVDWDRTAREVLTLEWIDGVRSQRPRRAGSEGLRSGGTWPQRNPELSSARSTRRLFSRRHASR